MGPCRRRPLLLLPVPPLAAAATGRRAAARAAGGPVWPLVTEAEAAASRAAPPPPLTRNVPLPGAPRIEVVAPGDANAVLRPPLTIHLRFVAAPGAVVDPASFRAFYGFLRLDITDRLRRHARIDASGLTAENVGLPSGEHRVSVALSDTLGRTGRQEFRIQVA